MARWLVKTDPETYSLADLERDRRTAWDGVSNNTALIHLRKFRAGDEVLIYHTGGEKAIVGVARVARDSYPDPKQKDRKLAVADLEFVRKLPKPLSLAEVKEVKSLARMPLVTIGRLSVMPVTDAEWEAILRLSGS
jgi:predicted RNA-binding protein with PUA-like domain